MPTGKISNLSDEIVIDPVVAEIIDHNTENFHQEYPRLQIQHDL